MEINSESLIEKVAAQQPIWDNRLAIYSAREIVDDCWKTISRQMNRPEHKLRKKWKYLRDQFCVEFGKISAGKESQWAHYNSLCFLADVVKPRQLKQSAYFRDSADDDDNSTHNDVSRYQMMTRGEVQVADPLADDSVDPLRAADETRDSSGPSRKRSADGELKPEAVDNKDLLKKILEKADSELEDDDMLFFRSLLPYVSKIADHKKLRFRSKILQVVDEFAYAVDSSTTSDSTVK
ncbi:hypothetical protein GE061_001897 [Apolygus lucorum]|uniref:MADF domain-containing protein n=1 Tax=Apolygus lucorum TaxID=248454 RepID=A0A6A4J5G0_APOLU|nr:hypothetical protein GE061_001897 [Apolygus lucorum]